MSDASEFFGGVRAIVGERFGEGRLVDGRLLSVTVIDLDEDDDAAVRRLADDLGVADRVRIERADPDHLVLWEQLRHDLITLQESSRGVLRGWPTPKPGYQRPPVRVVLDAGAEHVAADLHDRYGDFVELVVGALPYPLLDRPTAAGRFTGPRSAIDPAELRVDAAEPLVVASGGTTTADVVLTNASPDEISVHTTGHITAHLVDPVNGRLVGGYSGTQHQPRVVFRASPGEATRIPVLIGTASFDPDLGYVVPPGEWRLVVPLDLADGRRLAATLPLTVEPRV